MLSIELDRGLAVDRLVAPIESWEFGGDSGQRFSVREMVGFVVTARAYETYLRTNRLDEVVEGILQGIDRGCREDLEWASSQIQRVMMAGRLPDPLRDDLREAYAAMGEGAVTLDCLTATGMGDEPAGARSPLLQAGGRRGIFRGVRACWASLFSPKCIARRDALGEGHVDVPVAVSVRRI